MLAHYAACHCAVKINAEQIITESDRERAAHEP
jgi:hypothetical protein